MYNSIASYIRTIIQYLPDEMPPLRYLRYTYLKPYWHEDIKRVSREMYDLANDPYIEVFEEDDLDTFLELLQEYYALLHLGGYEEDVWKRWASMAVIGLSLREKFTVAAPLAAICSEWKLLEHMPLGVCSSPLTADNVLWELLGGAPHPTPKQRKILDPYWLPIPKQLAQNDYVEAAQSLTQIVRFYTQRFPNWQTYQAGRYPAFHLNHNALAALLVKAGMSPTLLPNDVQAYLEAGLLSRSTNNWAQRKGLGAIVS